MKRKLSFLAFAWATFFVATVIAQDRVENSSDRQGFQTKDAIVVSRPAGERAGATQLAVAADLRTIPVELKTDKTTYVEGEELVVTVRAAAAGHLRLLYQNAAGEIYTLFPNHFITDDLIDGGKTVRIVPTKNPARPDEEVAIQIAGPNFGTEHLIAVVSSRPFANEAALQEQLKKTTFVKSTAGSVEAAITKDARVISRPEREDGATAAGAGFSRVTLTTVRK